MQLLRPHLVLMLIIGVVLVRLWWRTPRPAWTARMGLCAYALLYLWSLPVINLALALWVATAEPINTTRPEGIDALVVLGGGVIVPSGNTGPTRLNTESLRRCMAAAEIYHAGPPLPLLVSGGKPARNAPGDPVAKPMAATLRQLGIPDANLSIEDDSPNTAGNAAASAAIAREQGWTKIGLVSSTAHLPRAAALFRKQGIDVVAIGTVLPRDEFEPGLFAFLPAGDALIRNQELLHEILGIAWLKLSSAF